MTTLRDAIADMIVCADNAVFDPPAIADAVLAMPEMRAIQVALDHVRDMAHPRVGQILPEFWTDLPESVREWVQS